MKHLRRSKKVVGGDERRGPVSILEGRRKVLGGLECFSSPKVVMMIT